MNLAVTDFTGLCGFSNGIDDGINLGRRSPLQFWFLQELNGELRTAVTLPWPFDGQATHFAHRHADDAGVEASLTSSSLNGRMIASTFS